MSLGFEMLRARGKLQTLNTAAM